MATQKEEEVAEKAEKNNPDHVKLKEQVESVETSSHRAQVFHKWWKALRSEIKRGKVQWRFIYEAGGRTGVMKLNNWTPTQHPEQSTEQADNQQLPDLLQALLGCRQQAAMSQLLEKLLPAEYRHLREHTKEKHIQTTGIKKWLLLYPLSIYIATHADMQ